MVELNSIQPKFRSRFKKLISSQRSHTLQNQSTNSTQKTLAELSQRTISEQKNKKIHNMSKQSYITNKKQFLLSRKLFYKPKTHQTKLLQMDNMKKFNKTNVYENLMDQTIQQEDVFNIQKEILNNPINFHRNMIIRVKDDQQTKGILRQWYKTNVTPNKNKLRSVSEINKTTSPTNSKNQQIEMKRDNNDRSSIFNRKKINLFTNQRLRNCKSNVNQSMPKKNLNVQLEDESKSDNTQKLSAAILGQSENKNLIVQGVIQKINLEKKQRQISTNQITAFILGVIKKLKKEFLTHNKFI